MLQRSEQVIGYVNGGVQSYHIHRAEGGRLRSTDERAGEAVYFTHAQSHLLNGVHGRQDAVDTDAVGNKRRSVFTEYGFFPQIQVAVVHKKVYDSRIGFGRRNDLQQTQVAGRVKEVGTAKVLLKVIAASL